MNHLSAVHILNFAVKQLICRKFWHAKAFVWGDLRVCGMCVQRLIGPIFGVKCVGEFFSLLAVLRVAWLLVAGARRVLGSSSAISMCVFRSPMFVHCLGTI